MKYQSLTKYHLIQGLIKFSTDRACRSGPTLEWHVLYIVSKVHLITKQTKLNPNVLQTKLNYPFCISPDHLTTTQAKISQIVIHIKSNSHFSIPHEHPLNLKNIVI